MHSCFICGNRCVEMLFWCPYTYTSTVFILCATWLTLLGRYGVVGVQSVIWHRLKATHTQDMVGTRGAGVG